MKNLAEPVFGSTLAEICAHEKTRVPKFITEVTSLIEQKGIDSDGFVSILDFKTLLVRHFRLYRVNGNLSSVQKIRCQIDQGDINFLIYYRRFNF